MYLAHGSASHFLHISSSYPLNVHPIICDFSCFLILRFVCKTRETTIDKQSLSVIKYRCAFLIADFMLPPPPALGCKQTAL